MPRESSLDWPWGAVVHLGRILRHGRAATSPAVEIGDTGVFAVTNATVSHLGCHSGAGIVLFDAGMDPKGRSCDRLLGALGARRDEVTHVFLTHAHADHVAALALFPGAKVLIGAADEARLRGHEDPKMPAERLLRRLLPTPFYRPTDLLEGRSVIELGSGADRVVAIPIPGHTDGAYAFHLRGVLCVGDAVDLRRGKLRFAAKYATDDRDENLRSIARLAQEVEGLPLDWICTAHGGVTPTGRAREMLAEVARRAARR